MDGKALRVIGSWESNTAPGDSADPYYFNEAPDGSAPNRWEQYGTGTVSPDGTRILTGINPATGAPYHLPRFCCGAFCFAANTTPSLAAQSLTPGGERVGEPVDAATGIFILEKTDLVLPGRLPIALTRTYQTNDATQGPFGLGSSAFFMELLLAPTPESLIYLQPGNTRIPFARQ